MDFEKLHLLIEKIVEKYNFSYNHIEENSVEKLKEDSLAHYLTRISYS